MGAGGPLIVFGVGDRRLLRFVRIDFGRGGARRSDRGLGDPLFRFGKLVVVENAKLPRYRE